MPQWRKLHTRIRQSLDVNDMPDDFHRLLWSWLPLGLDREGRILDNAALVKARVMPLREDVSLEQVQKALDWYADHGMIMRYSVNGRSYLHVPTFDKYQGRRGREAISIYPAPPVQEQVTELVHDQVTEPVMAQNRIEVEQNRIDVEEIPAPDKRARASSGKTSIRKALEDHFVARTKLPRPPMNTVKQKKAAGERWWQPLRRIAELSGQDAFEGNSLINAALKRLEGMTVSAPQSILKTCIAISAEWARDGPAGLSVEDEWLAEQGDGK